MKILITGGAGYIGSELVYRLAAEEAVEEILIYDNLGKRNYGLFIGRRRLPNGKVKFIQGDILDSRKLQTIMANTNVVYHLAAEVTTPFADQNAHLYEQVNHWGTAEVVYAAEETFPDKVIYLSSASVYGSHKNITSTEEPVNPSNFYAISKKRGEEHMQRLMEKLPVYIVRSANVYGYSSNLRFDAVVNRFMFNAHFKNRISVHGTGSQHRAFVSIERAVDLLCQLSQVDLQAGIYNLVDKNLSIIEIADTMSELYPNLEMIFINQHLPMQDIQMECDERMNRVMTLSEGSLSKDLQDFKEMFTF